MNGFKKLFRERAANIRNCADRLRRIPQSPVSSCEILSYVLVPFLFVMAGAMPSAALFILPVILCMLYLLYRRFGIYLPLACLAGYGVLSLTLNYDILSVIYLCGLVFAFSGVALSAQYGHYLGCAAIAAILASIGAFCGVGIVRLEEGEPIADIAAHYVIAERDDPVIGYLSRDYYDSLDETAGEVKLKPTDNGYALAAAENFGEWAADEFGLYIWYYCIHYGAVFGIAAYLVSHIINRRTASCYDAIEQSPADTEKLLRLSTRALGGARVGSTPMSEMSLPRAYLWACVLPALATSIVLDIVGGYEALSATVMHLFVTLPSAFCCFTLLTFFASLFKGKAKTAANVVVCIIGIAAVLFPIVLFILSVIGISDCILNLRFWTKFIMDD